VHQDCPDQVVIADPNGYRRLHGQMLFLTSPRHHTRQTRKPSATFMNRSA
jgi:hypothetical protein